MSRSGLAVLLLRYAYTRANEDMKDASGMLVEEHFIVLATRRSSVNACRAAARIQQQPQQQQEGPADRDYRDWHKTTKYAGLS